MTMNVSNIANSEQAAAILERIHFLEHLSHKLSALSFITPSVVIGVALLFIAFLALALGGLSERNSITVAALCTMFTTIGLSIYLLFFYAADSTKVETVSKIAAVYLEIPPSHFVQRISKRQGGPSIVELVSAVATLQSAIESEIYKLNGELDNLSFKDSGQLDKLKKEVLTN